jgi:acyl-CoA synthetase (AMP-forming)/AMP-acid ligase II
VKVAIIARSLAPIRGLSDMKVALTPIEFARRARRLYAKREAVIDGDLRYSYEEFLARCDRWSASLQRMGIRNGDRVAYIAPNTHAQLESFYAVPQIGAVLVPINALKRLSETPGRRPPPSPSSSLSADWVGMSRISMA